MDLVYKPLSFSNSTNITWLLKATHVILKILWEKL